MKVFNEKIANGFKEPRSLAEGGIPSLDEWEDLLEDDDGFAEEFHRLYDNADVPEADDAFDPDAYDDCLNMELAVEAGGHEHPQFAKVTKRLKDHRGNPISTAHSNPILDARMCEVEFADGSKQAMAANIVAEDRFASVDKEGHRHLLLDDVIGFHREAKRQVKRKRLLCCRMEFDAGWRRQKDGRLTFSGRMAPFPGAN